MCSQYSLKGKKNKGNQKGRWRKKEEKKRGSLPPEKKGKEKSIRRTAIRTFSPDLEPLRMHQKYSDCRCQKWMWRVREKNDSYIYIYERERYVCVCLCVHCVCVCACACMWLSVYVCVCVCVCMVLKKTIVHGRCYWGRLRLYLFKRSSALFCSFGPATEDTMSLNVLNANGDATSCFPAMAGVMIAIARESSSCESMSRNTLCLNAPLAFSANGSFIFVTQQKWTRKHVCQHHLLYFTTSGNHATNPPLPLARYMRRTPPICIYI